MRGQLAAAVAGIGKLKGHLRELRRDRFGRKSEALGTGPPANPGPPEQECACPQCGKACRSHGSEPSETIGIRIEAYRRELLRERCRPDCDCEEAREAIAEPPPRPADRSPPGVSVRAWFPVQVCERFRPQAAAVRELGSRGLPVPVATVSRNLRGPSALFAPLGEKILKRMEGAAGARADETSRSVQDPERLRALRQAPGTTGASAENSGDASQPLARAA